MASRLYHALDTLRERLVGICFNNCVHHLMLNSKLLMTISKGDFTTTVHRCSFSSVECLEFPVFIHLVLFFSLVLVGVAVQQF